MIRFERVHKWYGRHHVLDGVDLHVKKGMLLVLCGESGAGKSTLLATINGLESIDQGVIYVDGAPLSVRPRDLRALRRQIGVVFQSYNLFTHMTVEDNVRLGLEKSLGMARPESTRLAHEYLERVGLPDKHRAYPGEISGGQQQRVAIARCLAMRPKILLLDEPTAALDIDNSAEVIDTIQTLKSEGITILLATHQIGIYAAFADEVACMKDGRITESGTVDAILRAGGRTSQIASWLAQHHGDALGLGDRLARSVAADLDFNRPRAMLEPRPTRD